MPVDDDHIQPNGTILQPSSQATPNGMIAVIPVVRITASIKKTLKSRTITAATLNTYDQHFKAIMASYPDPFGIHSNTDLDPRLLTAACSLLLHFQSRPQHLHHHHSHSHSRSNANYSAPD